MTLNELVNHYPIELDEEDWIKYRFCSASVNDAGYVIVSYLSTRTSLHRILMNHPIDLVDHEDRNKLNCRKGNLRVATKSLNMANADTRQDNTSGYKGVTWDAERKKWLAQCKSEFVGRFEDKKDAARAYNARAKRIFGEFARLNDV